MSTRSSAIKARDAFLANCADPANPTTLDMMNAFFVIHSEQKTEFEQQKKATMKTDATVKNLDARISSTTINLERNINTNKINIYINSQQKLTNDIIIRGFPGSFDMDYALRKLLEIFNLKIEQVNDAYRYSFPIRISNTETKTLFQLSISFVSQLTKKAIINQLSKDGPILLCQLIESCAASDSSKTLILEHKLTRSNLAVKKAVHKLVASKEVEESRFKSFFYDIKLNDKWITIHDMNHLRATFPQNEELNPRRQKLSTKRNLEEDDNEVESSTFKSAKTPKTT